MAAFRRNRGLVREMSNGRLRRRSVIAPLSAILPSTVSPGGERTRAHDPLRTFVIGIVTVREARIPVLGRRIRLGRFADRWRPRRRSDVLAALEMGAAIFQNSTAMSQQQCLV